MVVQDPTFSWWFTTGILWDSMGFPPGFPLDLNLYFLILIAGWLRDVERYPHDDFGDLHLWATLTFLKFTPDLSVQKVQRFRKRTSRAPGMHHVQKKNSSRKFIKNHEIL